MARTRPPYTPEFRSEAVRLACTAGQPPAQIARDLGCCTATDAGGWEQVTRGSWPWG